MFLRLARENRLNPKSTYTCFKRANRDEGPGKVLVDARYSTRFKESWNHSRKKMRVEFSCGNESITSNQ